MLPDFTRVMWTSSNARSVWEPRIKSITAAWDAIERWSVVDGVRDSALQSIDPEHLPLVVQWAAGCGLVALPLARAGTPEFYGAGTADAVDGRPWSYRTAVTRPHFVRAWTAAWTANDDATIGRLLGFPECCQRFFARTWGVGSVDPTGHMDSTPGPVNILLRWLGVRPVPHMPCSFTCKASAEMAWQLADVGRRHGFAQEVEWTAEILSWPVEWSALHGIVEVKIPILKVATRTDYTPTKKVIRLEGTSYPAEGASGNVFPFQRPASVKPLTFHKSFKAAFAQQRVIDTWTDNGFSSKEAMDRAHAMVLNALKASPPCRDVVDLGAGNGVLVEKIKQAFSDVAVSGLEVDAAKAAKHEALVAKDIRTLLGSRAEFDTVVVSQRRFEEIPELEPWAHARARQVLVYSYDEPQFARVI